MSRRLLPLAGVLALALVPYGGFFSPRVPAGRDLLYYFYPLKQHLADAVRAGQVPWIDPFHWGGLPLLGAPGVASFDPGNLLFLVLPLGAAAKAWMLLRLAIGIAGFAAFARRLGLTPSGAAVAGLAFGLSGASVSTVPFLPTSSAFALVPWVAAFALDLRRAPGLRTALPLALAGGLVILASLPEVLLHAGLVALVLSMPERGARRGGLPRLAGAAFAALLLALGLGAAALVPGAVSAAGTVRGPGGGTNLEFASAGALPVKRLPGLLSDELGPDWAAGAPDPATPYPYLPSITPGRVALLLALLGLALGGPGRLRAGLLVALGLLLAVGRATPFFAAAVTLFPPLASLRYPEKHAMLAGFGFAFLAALGIRRLERAFSDRARRLVLPLLALAILVDRGRIARRLVETAGPETLDAPPALLAALPRAAPGAPPPRLFHVDSYAPVPAYDVRDLAAATTRERRRHPITRRSSAAPTSSSSTTTSRCRSRGSSGRASSSTRCRPADRCRSGSSDRAASRRRSSRGGTATASRRASARSAPLSRRTASRGAPSSTRTGAVSSGGRSTRRSTPIPRTCRPAAPRPLS